MQIEVFGPFNEGGSSMPIWVYEIDPACVRVLIMPHQSDHPYNGRVWGFDKDGNQIEGKRVSHAPDCVITG